MSDQDLPVVQTKTLPRPPTVPVVIEEQTILEPEAIARLRSMGMVDLPDHAVSDLATIGQHVHQTGTIRIQRGRALVTQQRLDRSMRLLLDQLEALAQETDPKKANSRRSTMMRLAQTVAYISGHLTRSQELALAMEGGRDRIDPSGLASDVTPSFTPGANIKPGGTLIMAREVTVNHPPNPR